MEGREPSQQNETEIQGGLQGGLSLKAGKTGRGKGGKRSGEGAETAGQSDYLGISG